MGEAGIFSEDDRVELIDGEVVEMAPIGGRHSECVYRLTQLFSRWVVLEAPVRYGDTEAGRLGVSVQNPLALSINGEPQLDLVLLRRGEGNTGVPSVEEALLIVEVADTSLTYDRNTKLPLYAEAGIPEAWLVDLTADEIEVHSEPGPGGYGRVARFGREDRIVSATLPNLAFDVAKSLPPEG